MTLYFFFFFFFLIKKDGGNISNLREGGWGARALLRHIHSCFDETKKKEKTGLARHLRKKSQKKKKAWKVAKTGKKPVTRRSITVIRPRAGIRLGDCAHM